MWEPVDDIPKLGSFADDTSKIRFFGTADKKNPCDKRIF